MTECPVFARYALKKTQAVLPFTFFLLPSLFKFFSVPREPSSARDYRLEARASILCRDKRFFSLLNVQTASEVHPSSYRMGTGGYFLRDKAAGS
jgi:hypothetical protein